MHSWGPAYDVYATSILFICKVCRVHVLMLTSWKRASRLNSMTATRASSNAAHCQQTLAKSQGIHWFSTSYAKIVQASQNSYNLTTASADIINWWACTWVLNSFKCSRSDESLHLEPERWAITSSLLTTIKTSRTSWWFFDIGCRIMALGSNAGQPTTQTQTRQ